MSEGAPRRLVVDLMSSAAHMRLQPDGMARLRASTPSGWETIIIASPAVSKGTGTSRPSDETFAAVGDAEVYFAFGVTRELVEAAPRLRWVHTAAAGVSTEVLPVLRARGILFTNSAGVYAEPMGDTVLAGVLHFLRGLDVAVRQQPHAAWNQAPFISPELGAREIDGATLLVIGAGGIGSAVARRFGALGVRCIGVRRRPELGIPAGFHEVAGVHDIDRLLPEADIVVIAAPFTDESRHILGTDRVALLRRDAIVVNVARGGLVEDDALLSALDAGRLRGAMLDVFATEPLPPESRYWSHPRVLVTPHVSGVSPHRHWGRALALFEENWRRWVAGEPLRNVVDLDAGY